MLILFGFRSIFISLPLSTVYSVRRTRVHLLDGKAYVGCVVEILIFIVHKYVTSNALVSGILSLPVPNLEGKVQGPIDRVCKINSHIRENLQSLGFLICEYRRDCTAPNTVSCRQSKNYDLQSVCSTCKNVEYMYRTFSVAVSLAVMLLKKGSVQ